MAIKKGTEIFIAAMEGEGKGILTDHDKELFRVAMAYHDVVMGDGGEIASAQIAAEEMNKAGYTAEDIEMVREMILATVVIFDEESKVMYQSVEYNNTDKTKETKTKIRLLKKIAADADLGHLGSDWETSSREAFKLGREFNKFVNPNTPTPQEWFNYWTWQSDFLTKIRSRNIENGGYYTKSAGKILPNIGNNIDMANKKVAKYA